MRLCRKEEVSYLQQAEAILVRRTSDAFQQRVEAYRAFFLKTAPFAITEERLKPEHVSLPLQAFTLFLQLPSTYRKRLAMGIRLSQSDASSGSLNVGAQSKRECKQARQKLWLEYHAISNIW